MIDLSPYVGKSVFVQLRQALFVLQADDKGAPSPSVARQRSGGEIQEVPLMLPIIAGTVVTVKHSVSGDEKSFAIEYKDQSGSTLRSMLNTDIISSITEVTDHVPPKQEPPKAPSLIVGVK